MMKNILNVTQNYKIQDCLYFLTSYPNAINIFFFGDKRQIIELESDPKLKKIGPGITIFFYAEQKGKIV